MLIISWILSCALWTEDKIKLNMFNTGNTAHQSLLYKPVIP